MNSFLCHHRTRPVDRRGFAFRLPARRPRRGIDGEEVRLAKVIDLHEEFISGKDRDADIPQRLRKGPYS